MSSGAMSEGPLRSENLESRGPMVSERGMSLSPFNRVTVLWTHSPFFDLLTPKRVRGVTKLFQPLKGPLTICKWRPLDDRPFRRHVRETARPIKFKINGKWDFFFKRGKRSQISQGGSWGPPRRSA